MARPLFGRRCAVDSVMIPGSEKFTIVRFGNNHLHGGGGCVCVTLAELRLDTIARKTSLFWLI